MSLFAFRASLSMVFCPVVTVKECGQTSLAAGEERNDGKSSLVGGFVERERNGKEATLREGKSWTGVLLDKVIIYWRAEIHRATRKEILHLLPFDVTA
jgi:hypothetical protein